MTRGLMIAAPRSGSGKTTATLGLLRAFRRRGVDVVGLKSGPDYIDPAFHAAASGPEGVNLDSWAMPPKLLAVIAAQASADRDLACARPRWGCSTAFETESGRSGASADVAAALGLPVLMVIDVSGQAQSAAAVVKGCATYDAAAQRRWRHRQCVGSERHRRLVVEAIEAKGIPVVGALPRNDKVALPERHLGLVQAGETQALDARLEQWPILSRRMSIATASSHWPGTRSRFAGVAARRAPAPGPAHRARARRGVFVHLPICAGWRAAGAEIVSFSPLADEPPPPDFDLCWLPGGYPELYAGRLPLRRVSRRPAATSPRRAPCTANAGLYGAGRKPHDATGRRPSDGRPARRRDELRKASPHTRLSGGAARGGLRSGSKGATYRGHEFHYSTIASSERTSLSRFVATPTAPPPRRRLAERPRHRLVLSCDRRGVTLRRT